MTSTTNRTNHSHPGPTVTTTTSTNSCNIVSASFTQRPNTEVETPEHKTLNNTLVTTNEVLSITWKLSVSHAPHIHNTKITQESRIILVTGLKLENQHTRIQLCVSPYIQDMQVEKEYHILSMVSPYIGLQDRFNGT